MKVNVHKGLTSYNYKNVIQVTFTVMEACDELDMPQETMVHILTKKNDIKQKAIILCDETTTITVLEEK